jgi:hypothetical protein
MKKIAALLLLVLTLGAFPTSASARDKYPPQKSKFPPNKYQGLDRASRKAQKKEQQQIERYAKKQRKAERKMLKSQSKRNAYKPKHF